MSSRAAFFGCLLLACVVGCKQKSEEPPPLASATPEATLAPSAAPAPEAAPSATAAAESAEAGSAGHPALAAQGEEAAAARGADGDAGKRASPLAGQSIKGCCAALASAAKTDAMHASRYKAAAAVCAGLVSRLNSGGANLSAVRTTLRAQLQGIPVPGGC